jgi:hypothetical protein
MQQGEQMKTEQLQEPRDYRFVLVGLVIAAAFFLGYAIGAKA